MVDMLPDLLTAFLQHIYDLLETYPRHNPNINIFTLIER